MNLKLDPIPMPHSGQTRPGRLHDGIVSIDEWGPFRAKIVSDQRWNGWVVPYFTIEQVQILAAETARKNALWGETLLCPITIDERGIVTITDPQWDDDEGRAEIATPSADGLYSIGGFSWCWSEDPQLWIARSHRSERGPGGENRHVSTQLCSDCRERACDPNNERPAPCRNARNHAQHAVDNWRKAHPGEKFEVVRCVWLDEIANLVKEEGRRQAHVEAWGGGTCSVLVGDLMIGSADGTGFHSFDSKGYPVDNWAFGEIGELHIADQSGNVLYETTRSDNELSIALKAIELLKERGQ